MAGMVDHITNTIIGTEVNTFQYWHEVCHLIYNQSKIGMRLVFFMETFFFYSVGMIIAHFYFPVIKIGLLSISLFKHMALILFTMYFLLYFFEEGVCNIYAWQRTRTNEKRKMIFGFEWIENQKQPEKKLKINTNF